MKRALVDLVQCDFVCDVVSRRENEQGARGEMTSVQTPDAAAVYLKRVCCLNWHVGRPSRACKQSPTNFLDQKERPALDRVEMG